MRIRCMVRCVLNSQCMVAVLHRRARSCSCLSEERIGTLWRGMLGAGNTAWPRTSRPSWSSLDLSQEASLSVFSGSRKEKGEESRTKAAFWSPWGCPAGFTLSTKGSWPAWNTFSLVLLQACPEFPTSWLRRVSSHSSPGIYQQQGGGERLWV